MSLEQEAKDFVESKLIRPKTVQCCLCLRWSGYNLENNNKLPYAWTEMHSLKVCDRCITKHNKEMDE